MSEIPEKYNIDNAKNDIQNLQAQNSYDFQEIKRLDGLLKDYDKRVLQAININNQINKKIEYMYENFKKLILDENVSFTLNEKMEDIKQSITDINNIIDKIQLTNIEQKLQLIQELSNSFTTTFGDLSINVLEKWIEANGSSSDYGNFKHVEIVGVKTGEIYRIKNQCGSNIRAYVIKNSGGSVTRAYKQENYGTKHDYDLKVTINSDEEGGTLYINTFTDMYIGVQTVNGKAIDALQLANKNTFILSNLYGKKIIFFGDSITANKGSWGDAETIRAKYNMTGANYAVGGMTYSVRSDSNDTNNIYLRIQSKLSNILDADYICFQGGTNDAFRGAELGEMLAEDDFTTELSTSTFAGAFEMACRLLRTQVPSAKLLYLVNLKIPRNRNLKNYVEMAKKICNKYSIKYLDLWNDSGMSAGVQSFNDKYYSIDNSVSTEHGDQTHPTVEGYKVHLNDKVDFALNAL